MTLKVQERNIGRRLNSQTCERAFTILGAVDEVQARNAMILFVSDLFGNPLTYNGMFIDYDNTEVEEFGELMFYGVVRYKALQQLPNSFHISFDISGINSHITQSKATVRYPGGGQARDFKGAICVDSDGTINGTDIIIPYFTYKVTYTWDHEEIDDDYIATLKSLVGKVNLDPFHEFEAGTNLLTAVSGQERDNLAWDLTYNFACSENKTGITVGDITGIEKKGWQFLWVYYLPETDSLADGTPYHRKVPKSVYVETVFDEDNFSQLGI